MGFNSAFKGLSSHVRTCSIPVHRHRSSVWEMAIDLPQIICALVLVYYD